ncbi:heterokaryon incompatibility protein-domain-containing protein [Daldinia loculata]|nr:heterokaryon incompatibility protein-domain-containing protein [Daldinia loculata]
MRLLNTTSLELKEFQGDTVPPYAILSHTWIDGEEISFHDFVDLSPSTTTKSGFLKIQGASAELTEDINSMYNWYRQSTVCYAYLADVPKLHPEKEDGPLRLLCKSKWLRRGWTLQELIGPRRLVFFSGVLD